MRFRLKIQQNKEKFSEFSVHLEQAANFTSFSCVEYYFLSSSSFCVFCVFQLTQSTSVDPLASSDPFELFVNMFIGIHVQVLIIFTFLCSFTFRTPQLDEKATHQKITFFKTSSRWICQTLTNSRGAEFIRNEHEKKFFVVWKRLIENVALEPV